MLMSKYLKTEGDEAYRRLQEDASDVTSWRQLSAVTLSLVILFNRRRTGEVSKMTVDDFHAKHTAAQEDVLKALSPFERELCSKLKRIEIVGKKGGTVPMLCTEKMLKWMELLFSTRDSVGIPPENIYLFARTFYGSLGHIRGTDTLRDHSEACGAKFPELLRGTKLRKQLATLSQILNLQDHEMDIIAKFLGHDIRVHRDYYRLPEETIQVAKVSKLLIAMEDGQFLDQRGKSLGEIDVNINDDLEFEDEGDTDASGEDSDTESNGEDGSLPEKVVKAGGCKKTKKKPIKRRSGPETEVTDSDDSCYIPEKKKKKTKGKKLQKTGTEGKRLQKKGTKALPLRRLWSEEEESAVLRHFKKNVFLQNLPGKKLIEECKAREQVLNNRSWKNIKDFVKNKITTYKRRKMNKSFIH